MLRYRRLQGLLLSIALCAVASAEPVLLQNIPPTSWNRPDVPVSILHTALAGVGCPTTYEDLLVLSGAAFRMGWRPGIFNFPANRLYQQDPITMGGAAVGARVERRQFATAQQAYDAAADAIDAGSPVIAWDSGRVDWQVICGYDEPKQTLFRRTLNTGLQPDERPADCLISPGTAYGAKADYELWLISYDATKAPPATNWPFIIANALRLAQWPDEDRLYGAFVCGDCAYFAWATDLRSTTLYTQPSAGEVSWQAAWRMEKCRRFLGNVLQANMGVHPALGQAALLYQDEADLFAKIQEALCGGQQLAYGEAQQVVNENIKDDGVREASADLVEQALAKNRAARAALRTALKDLAPELLPMDDGTPAVPLGQAQ